MTVRVHVRNDAGARPCTPQAPRHSTPRVVDRPCAHLACSGTTFPTRRRLDFLPMIVEFMGSSGAGKSTLAKLLRGHNGVTGPIMLSADLVMDHPSRRWIHNPTAINVVADLIALPSFLRTMRRKGDFLRFAFHRLKQHAPSKLAKYNYMREIVRNVGIQELARRAEANATIIVDEGPVTTASHLFVYSDGRFSQADLDNFARLLPLPDRVIYVRAPEEVLVRRAMWRPDRRRELSADDREEVEHWIARARDVFDGLAEAPAIRDRVLAVEYADDSPDNQRAVVAQIVAFINEQNRTGHPGKESVSPRVSGTSTPSETGTG
jgi:thymidylate kinase